MEEAWLELVTAYQNKIMNIEYEYEVVDRI